MRWFIGALGWALLFGCEADNPGQRPPCVGPGCVDAQAPGDAQAQDQAVDARVDARAEDRGSQADRAVEDAGPDGAVADAALTDTAVPDGAVEDAAVPDGAVEDAARPDGAVEDAAVPDGAVLDAVVEDAAPPDLAVEDAALPDVGPCGPGIAPAAERCNGLDDDCDGNVDEGLGIGGACEAPGRCGVGFLECDGAGGLRCSTAPGGSVDQSRPERCNGLDDDCDGQADEAPETLAVACYEGPEGTLGVGLCAGGVQRCVGGRLEACAGAVLPAAEVCNGLDEDCDGAVDEGYVAVAVCGQGVCRAAATPSACVGGVEVPCAPGPPAGDDANCDGVDDDCDGAVDEGYVAVAGCGVGRCGATATPSACVAGVERPCQPGPAAPIDRLCDGVDDDCDGAVDEDYVVAAVCGQGVCQAAAVPSRCEGGVETACAPGPPAGDDGNCDGLDDDCDGRVDEGYAPVLVCGAGVCAERATPSRCILGEDIACRPGPPQGDDANCDGLDDDCDGRIDEGFRGDLSCGLGVCGERASPSVCEEGVELACVPGDPNPEADDQCDGVDDDCDGQADEAAPQLVGGPVRLTDHQAGAIEPRIAARQDAPGFAVAWSDNRPGEEGIHFLRLSEAGVPRGASLRLAAQAGVARRPDIVADGPDSYAVVWTSTAPGAPQVFFARVGADGNLREPPVRLVETGQDAVDPRVVYNGAEYAVAWTDARHGEGEIYLRRLARDGRPIGEATRLTDVPGSASGPSLVHNGQGGGYALAYNEAVGGVVEAWLQRVNVNGQPLGARLVISDDRGNSNGPQLARRPEGGYVVVWSDTRDNQNEIYAAELSNLGVRQSPLLRITEDNFSQTVPALCPVDDGTFAVAWMDRRHGVEEVYVRRLDASGGPRTPELRVTEDPSTSFLPHLAFSGQTFGIVWYDGRHGEPEIYFARGPLGCPL